VEIEWTNKPPHFELLKEDQQKQTFNFKSVRKIGFSFQNEFHEERKDINLTHYKM
jgi:hypothetical protein